MGSYMLNSIIVTALAITLLIVIALPAAYVLARFKFRSSKFWNVMFMAGLFINVNYIVVPIFLMLSNGDTYLRKTIGHPFFLNNLFILAVVYAATALPFTIYLLSGYFKSLARDYEEAAYVDGAGYFRTMVQVILPMAKPSIVTVVLFNFLAFWNEYIISMTMLTKPELKTLPEMCIRDRSRTGASKESGTGSALAGTKSAKRTDPGAGSGTVRDQAEGSFLSGAEKQSG